MKIQFSSIISALLITGGTGHAAVMDFESATISTACNVYAGGSLDGFTFNDNSDLSDGYSSGFSSSACIVFAPTAHSGSNYATSFNFLLGGFERTELFSIQSLWVHPDARVSGTTTVEFFGYAGSLGSTTLYSMTVDITAGWTEVIFDGWDNLGSFAWGSLNPDQSNISIDDVTYTVGEVSPIPLPASLPLLAFGLGGLGLMARHKRKVS